MNKLSSNKRYTTLVIEHEGNNTLPFAIAQNEYNSTLNGVITGISLSDVVSEMEVLEMAIDAHSSDPQELEDALEKTREMHDRCVMAHRALKSRSV